MKTEYVGLWQRIAGFSLDSPGAELPFSTRLAKRMIGHPSLGLGPSRNISASRTWRWRPAIPVSPPDAVDQVWHLHLTYTQNYWKKFCAEILAKPLHHQPTEGGVAESEKFQDWYRRTLESYREHFKLEPPRDIWPDLDERMANAAGTLAWTKPQIGSFPGLGWRGLSD